MFSLSAVAARLRSDDPLFDQLPDEIKHAMAQEAIAAMGGDPDDILTVALVVAPPEARRVAGEVMAGLTSAEVAKLTPKPKQAPLVARYMLATKLTDGQMAAIIGMSRPTVNLWKNGHIVERFNPTQKEALIATAREQIEAIQAVLDELVDNDQPVGKTG